MQQSLFDLSGKVAVVTGANTGLGQGIAIALARAGADIAAVGRTTPDETSAAVRQAGARFLFVEAELESTAPIAHIVVTVEENLGPIDILVNNAATNRRGDALDISEADWDAVVDTNLKTAFFLSQATARAMLDARRGGKIIQIASLRSFQGGSRVAPYTASKSGLLGLTRLLASEWAAHGINVNAIAPGYFETRNTEDLRNDPVRAKAILERIPAGRWGVPSDLAGAIVFLASAASDYVHGAVLPVDGGWLAR
jgi:2-deoxy-D-gluconate 3-dehydrogenase